MGLDQYFYVDKTKNVFDKFTKRPYGKNICYEGESYKDFTGNAYLHHYIYEYYCKLAKSFGDKPVPPIEFDLVQTRLTLDDLKDMLSNFDDFHFDDNGHYRNEKKEYIKQHTVVFLGEAIDFLEHHQDCCLVYDFSC